MIFLSILQFIFGYPLKVIIFVLAFTVPLKRRNYYYLRAVGCGAVYLALFFLIPITQGYIYNVVLFSLSTLWILACFKCTVYALVYTAVGAFAGQHISQYVFKFVQTITGIPSNEFAGIFLSMAICFFVAVCCYLMFVRKVRDVYMTKSASVIINSVVILGLTVLCGEFIPDGMGAANLLFCIYAIVSCVLALNVQYGIFRRTELEFNRKELEQLILLERKNQESAKRSIEMVNIRCHDLKHQIELLESENENSSKRRELLDELKQTVSDYDNVVNTGWEPMDTVIAEKNYLCKRQDIKFSFIVDGKALSFMSDLDAYTLFANAIDNAVEAVVGQEKEKRIISMSVVKMCGFVRIKVENYFEGSVTFSDELPVTTKTDGGLHGYGTRSMKYIVQKYGGTMTVTCQSNYYTVNIIIPLQE